MPTLEVADHYPWVKILSQRSNKMTRGLAVAQKRDGKGNAMGRVHENFILDTTVCQV